MEKSTIIGISVLAVAGTAFYFYSKGKKSTTTNSTVTTPTPPTNDIKALADLGVKIEEPKVTPYVAQSVPIPTVSLENIQKALLALNIDTTRSVTELSSPNYIEAKRIVGNMKEIQKIAVENREGVMYAHSGCNYTYVPDSMKKLTELSGQKVSHNCGNLTPKLADILSVMTKKVNALGYKVLPNFDIEKM